MNAISFNKGTITLVVCLVMAVLAAVSCSRAKPPKPTARDAEALRELKAADPWRLNPEQVQQLVTLADEGDGEAAWMLCNYFEHERDPTARKYLMMAVHLGVPEAQCSHYAILIQSPDRSTREKAVVWLEKAAKQGYKPAEEYLAMHSEVLKVYDRRHGTERK